MTKLQMLQIRQAVLSAIIDYEHADNITSEGLESILNRASVQIQRAMEIENADQD